MRRACVGVIVMLVGSCVGDENPLPVPLAYPSALTVTEGGLTTFVLALGELSKGDGYGRFIDPFTGYPVVGLSFTPDRFSLSPTSPASAFTIKAIDPARTVDEKVGVLLYLSGTITGDSPGMQVLVVTEEAPNIIASSWNITMATSSTATFDVRLTQPPSAIPDHTAKGFTSALVTVALHSLKPEMASVTPTTLVFGDADYDVPQTVTITSTANLMFPGTYIGLAATNSSLRPVSIIPEVTVAVTAPYDAGH